MPELLPNVISEMGHIPFLGLGGFLTLGSGGIFSSVQIVRQGELGVRLRHGQASRQTDSRYPWLPMCGEKGDDVYAILRPGIHTKIPFTHSIVKLSTIKQVTPFPEITADSKKNTAHDVRGSLEWRIVPEFDAEGEPVQDWEKLMCVAAIQHHTSENGLKGQVIGRAADGLRTVMGNYKKPHKVRSEKILADLQSLRGDELREQYGAELLNVNIDGASYTNAQKLGSLIAEAHPWMAAVGAAGDAEVFGHPRFGSSGASA